VVLMLLLSQLSSIYHFTVPYETAFRVLCAVLKSAPHVVWLRKSRAAGNSLLLLMLIPYVKKER
jgi:hypothetical protein